MTRIVPKGIDRRALLKSSAAAGAALATGIAMPAIAQTRPIKLGYVSPQTGPLAAFAEADNFIIANFKEATGGQASGPRRSGSGAKQTLDPTIAARATSCRPSASPPPSSSGADQPVLVRIMPSSATSIC